MNKELIYQLLCGDVDTESVILPYGVQVEDAFSEGTECGKLYEELYQTKERLLRRLATEEDKDLEHMVDCMNEIARLLSYQMYEIGRGQRQKK